MTNEKENLFIFFFNANLMDGFSELYKRVLELKNSCVMMSKQAVDEISADFRNYTIIDIYELNVWQSI